MYFYDKYSIQHISRQRFSGDIIILISARNLCRNNRADNSVHSFFYLFHIQVKGVRNMDDIALLTIRLPREEKQKLMECAVASDLTVSQLIRHLIRKYVF